MTSSILQAAARPVLAGILLVSVFMLFRGHNEPGGGFIGGLLAAAGFALHGLARGTGAARALLGAPPLGLAVGGVTLATAAGLAGWLVEGAFLDAAWTAWKVPGVGKLGTVLLFDTGVYLTVLGAVLAFLFALDEEAGPWT